jgi:hypothetical protein
MSTHIGGQGWEVLSVSPKSKKLRNEKGERLDGKCDYNKCRIYVSNALEAGSLEDTILHECVHALLFVSRADEEYNRDEKIEENVVGKLTPVLHRFLKDCGFKLPVTA